MKSVEDLDVFKLAHQLTLKTYAVTEEKLLALKKETGELKGIFVAIVRNTKAKSKPSKP